MRPGNSADELNARLPKSPSEADRWDRITTGGGERGKRVRFDARRQGTADRHAPVLGCLWTRRSVTCRRLRPYGRDRASFRSCRTSMAWLVFGGPLARIGMTVSAWLRADDGVQFGLMMPALCGDLSGRCRPATACGPCPPPMMAAIRVEHVICPTGPSMLTRRRPRPRE